MTETTTLRPTAASPTARTVSYSFRYADRCNMCGSDVAEHRVLGLRMNGSQGLWPSRKIGVATTILRCRRCGLVHANPLPAPLRIEDHYGIAPESYWHESYFEVSNDYFRNQIERFEALQGCPTRGRGLKALDIGAGIGKGMVALERAGFEAHGIEPSEPFYRRALERTGIATDHLQLAGIDEAEHAPDSFDFIVFGAVLEHLFDPAESIRKALEWIKPDGLIYIEVPSSEWLMSRLARAYYVATGSGNFVINTSPMHAPFHLYEFSRASFLRNGAAANYDVIFHEYFICRGYLPRLLDPFVGAIMKATDTGMQLAVWLRKRA